MANPIEALKREKHGFDVWPDLLAYSHARTPMKDIPTPDLERMKWYGVFYRKRDTPGTYMLRIRLTANELSAAQAKEIARIAYDLGYGIVDITTRANIQVQGLAIDDVPRAIERLELVDLTAKQTGLDNVRNVFGHPLSGVDPEELIDTRPLCCKITEVFLNNRELADLPRKFNIAMCGSAKHAIHYWTQDLSFLAVRRAPASGPCPGSDEDATIGFRVLIGGKQGQTPQLGQPLPISISTDQVPHVTKAVLELFREQGQREKRDAARFNFLIEKIGIGGVLAEIERRLTEPFERCDSELAPPSGYDELVGWFRQAQHDRWAVGLCPALGRMSWLQLEGVAVSAERWADGQLRTTPEQGLMILNIPSSFRDALSTHIAQWNLSVHTDSRTRSTVACTGKQFCNIAVTETKAHALHLIEKLRERSLELYGIRIHMSGCPSSCANHHTADIGLKGVRVKRLLGTREGFDVFLGGGLRRTQPSGVAGRLQLAMPYRTGVDVDQLPNLIDEVVREYYLRHNPCETFSDYWRNKLAEGKPAAAKEEDFRPPVWECDHCSYRHTGEDPPVYCPQCGALRRHFARWEENGMPVNGEAVAPALSVDGYAMAADITAIPDGRGMLVRIAGNELALFRVGDQICAVDNTCPHAGGSLSDGTLEDSCITCPLHGWKFDVSTGASVETNRPGITRYPTRIENGKVLVRVGGPVATGI